MKIPDDIHHELKNWGRAQWAGAFPHPLPATHCGSAEGAYRAPPEWDTLDRRREPVIRPNMERANVVQGVYRDRLTDIERLVLKGEYPDRMAGMGGREAAARRLKLPTWAYERHLQSAVDKVGSAFRAYDRRVDVVRA